MLEGSPDWDHWKLELVLPFHKYQVLQIKPSLCNASDELVWLKTASGTLPAWICWNLWISRNQLTFQSRTFSPMETLSKAIKEARDWSLAQLPHPKPQTGHPSIAQDPINDPSQACMYTDAAWNPLSKRAGLGWIIDDSGSTTTYSATSPFVASPLIAETLALRAAMISANTRGITALCVYSDSLTLIKLVKKKGRNLEIAGILNDIYLFFHKFIVIQFKHIPRADNNRADSIAKQALGLMYEP
ncbi:hypothetical protein F2Q68_00024691 [Brassica cretica]|uniref:RNase H type-1 domain-containing protein n=1 Tax=Brassica cretica TaxID=69181 RepID=A0A8S9I8J2_BRACR|nr:hypothetical protein F2Q68_00024691 [Brassica cretica]